MSCVVIETHNESYEIEICLASFDDTLYVVVLIFC